MSLICLENVCKTYRMGDSDIHAMNRISLTIEKGDLVAFMGPSGSGKSTLMNVIGCLDRPDSGKYILNGQDVSQMDDDRLSVIRNQTIGFVHQNFNLLQRLNALENVALPLVYAGCSQSERVRRARKCLQSVGLADRELHLPVQLSGGQQQRVAIARALVNEAPVILADEPTGNVDSKSSVEIMNILERLHEQGVTIIVVTHEKEIADWARQIYYVRDGCLGGTG